MVYIILFCVVNNTGPETLPVSACNCFLYFTCKENILKMFV